MTKDNYLKCKDYKYNYFCSNGLKTSQCLCAYDGFKTRNTYEKEVKELFIWLCNNDLVKNYQMCSVAYLNKQQFQDFLKYVYFNPYYKKGFKQLNFNDYFWKGGDSCA